MNPQNVIKPRRLRPVVLGLAAVTAAAGLVGCGSSKPTSTAPAGPTSTASSTGSPSTASASSPSTTASLPSDASLQAALLTAADLGPSFTASQDNGGQATASGCKPLVDLINSSAPHQVGAEFEASSAGPYVGEAITAGTPADLQAAFSSAKTALTSCKSITFSTGGQTITFQLSPIQLDGANSVSVRLDGTLQGVQINGYMAMGNLPNAIVGFNYLQLESGSSQVADELYTKALNKAQQVLSGPSPTAQATPS